MSFVQKHPATTQRSIWHVAVEKTQHLAHSAKHRRVQGVHCQAVREILEALPLATAEFARLTYAEPFLHSDEHGEAGFRLTGANWIGGRSAGFQASSILDALHYPENTIAVFLARQS